MGMGAKSFKTTGGSGGKKGHSNMVHWTFTEEIKVIAKKARRMADRALSRPRE